MLKLIVLVLTLALCSSCSKPTGNWKEAMDNGYRAVKAGDFKKAEEDFSVASGIAEAQFGPKSDKYTRSISELGNVYLELAKYDKASTFFKQALEIDKRIVDPSSPVIADDLNDIGRCYFEEGKLNRAKEFFEQALKVAKKNAGSRKAAYVKILANLAVTICYLEDNEAAEPYVDRALKTFIEIDDKSSVLKTVGKLAKIVASQGDYEEADKLYEQAIELEKDYYGESSHRVINTLSNASEFYRCRKNYDLAEKYGVEALKLSNKYYGKDSKHSAMLLCHLGLLYGKKGEARKSRKYMERGIKCIEETLGDEHPVLGIEMVHLGEELVEEEQFKESIPVFQRAATILESSIGSDTQHLYRAYNGLACSYQKGDNLVDAEIYYKKAIGIQEALYGEESARMITALDSLKQVKEQMKDSEAVEKLNNRIKRLEEANEAMVENE